MVGEGRAVAGDRLPAGARADAGLHRRARRSSTSRRCATRWRSSAATPQDQSAGARRARDRPLGPGRRVRGAARFLRNAELEFERNKERYAFLRWGQKAFDNFSVVPPDTGICHQVNLEYLGRVVVEARDGQAFPDTLVGTDSHTTMINGLGVLGWGVGGIEAEAAMLGQPVSMLIPQVVGFRLTGELPEGSTATDLVLTVTRCCARAASSESSWSSTAPDCQPAARRPRDDREHGAGDGRHVRDLPGGRGDAPLPRVPAARPSASSWWRRTARSRASSTTRTREEATFTDTLELDLGDVEPSLAGPKRPQDRVALSNAAQDFCA